MVSSCWLIGPRVPEKDNRKYKFKLHSRINYFLFIMFKENLRDDVVQCLRHIILEHFKSTLFENK